MSTSRSNWTGISFGLALACFAAYQQFKLPPALPVLLETYRYDRTLAGAFMSVYAVAGLAFSLLFGRLLERQGVAGPTLAALALSMAGTGLVLALPESGWTVLLGRALEGVGFAFLAICGMLLANANASARHLPLVVGMTAAWIPVGQLAAMLLAPIAFAWQGWQPLWIVALIGALALAAWTLALRGSAALDPPAAPAAPGPAPGGTIAETIGGAARLKLAIAAGIFMLWSSQYFAYMTWLPQYLVEVHGLSASMAAAGNMIPVAVLIATTAVVGMVLRAGVPVGPLLVCGLATQAAIWWLVPVTGAGLGGVISLIFYGIAAGICPTCLFAMPSIIVGRGRVAAPAFGIIMTGRNIGVLIGPVLLAQAFEVTGAWDLAAPIFGTVTSLAFGLGIWLTVALAGARYGTSR
ncbi:MAG: MFS transporter [Proteobacteria bacterium]|nr:MFS transporter [Pseudomonadota bacterium]